MCLKHYVSFLKVLAKKLEHQLQKLTNLDMLLWYGSKYLVTICYNTFIVQSARKSLNSLSKKIKESSSFSIEKLHQLVIYVQLLLLLAIHDTNIQILALLISAKLVQTGISLNQLCTFWTIILDKDSIRFKPDIRRCVS